MKSTGLVRRIDDLGRVVIPKEIRRPLHIHEGDPFEIYLDGDGGIVFKKYSGLTYIEDLIQACAVTLSRSKGYEVLICDTDHIKAVEGVSKRQFLGCRISSDVEVVLRSYKPYVRRSTSPLVKAVDGEQRSADIVHPIISKGEVIGAIIILCKDGPSSENKPSPEMVSDVQLAASMLGYMNSMD